MKNITPEFHHYIILFDIDNTLIDTGKLIADIKAKLCKKYNLQESFFDEKLKEYYATISRTAFNPKDFLKSLNVKETPEKVLEDFYDEEIFKQAVYPKMLALIKKLKKNHLLGIFSEGVKDYQMKKLQFAGLLPYFSPENIFISSDKCDQEYLQKLPSSMIVDDKPEIIERVNTFLHLQGVLATEVFHL